MIFGIDTASDISKLLYVVKFETILKYHGCYLCHISLEVMLLFVYTTTRNSFVIFTCRYFKLRWNTTALSQSNCRNFSCSSIYVVVISYWAQKFWPPLGGAFDWLKQIINQLEALARSGCWHVISMEFLRSFLSRHFSWKPVVASPNVGCFLKLW